jgi:DNA-binding response OmpR family regulator
MAVILVVDDDRDSRWMLAALMVREGHTVIEATDGLEASRLFRAYRPDAVLLDLFMPNQDGFQTIRELRRDFPGSRIIAVSAGWSIGKEDSMRRARQLGADLTIRKPIDLDVLRSAVKELLAA